MTDSRIARSAMANDNGGRAPSRFKRDRNSIDPTANISFVSSYGTHGHGSSSSSSDSETSSSLFSFDLFVGLAHCFLIAFCGLLAFVFGSTSHIIQFDNNKMLAQLTNNMDFKSLLFVIGLVITQGEALVAFRIHRHELKLIAHVVHFLLHLAGLALAILLLVAMIQHKNLNGETYFSSFASWISLILVAAFIVQSLSILINLIFPKHAKTVRNNFSPVHKVFAISIFIVSVLLSITGLQQYTGVLGECYNQFTCPKSLAAILNCGVLCLIGYCISITTLITNTDWTRRPTVGEKKKL